MARLAFIGTGVMGAPMAGHLVRAGHQLTGFNRTRAKAKDCADDYGSSVVDTPADAARVDFGVAIDWMRKNLNGDRQHTSAIVRRLPQ
jgi:3-hydroxyisobutyrate dehydrogenase-like beta-hydroxyacid dehydrogenase